MAGEKPHGIDIKTLVDQILARKGELSADQLTNLSIELIKELRGRLDVTVSANQPASDQFSERANQPHLSPEQMTELLTALEDRFTNHPEHYKDLDHLPRLSEDVTFEEIRGCLEKDPVLAKQVYAMHARGGDPDVWSRDGNSFLFFESVQNTTQVSRDCVYGKAQADWLRENRKSEPFDGSVEEQRADMGGVGVVAEEMWWNMQNLGPFTDNSWEWVDSDDIKDTGDARYTGRGGGRPDVFRVRASLHYPYGGWRAVAKGSET